MARIEKNDSGWVLTRDGAPYFIKGAGGDDQLELLVACGGNSIRTWGTDGAGPILDRAHALGLSVTLGLWLQHERHGFDYGDPAFVARQFETAKRHVLQFKDHPALLLWGIGNEMEASGENEKIWRHVNEIGRMIHDVDPDHPTMTVTADASQVKIDALKRHCPEIDILGVNSYGGLPTVPERLGEFGWTRPYIVTEFGPKGWWEVGKTSWGAELEPTSTEKAAFYYDNYRHAIESRRGWCLGSYVFKWGFKQEHTGTWFSMFSESGAKYSTVEAMTRAWTGRASERQGPVIRALKSVASERMVKPREEHRAELELEADTRKDHPDSALRYRWEVLAESSDKREGGDAEAAPRAVADAVTANGGNAVTIRAPEVPGAYRLYAYVEDGHGNLATANFPFFVGDN